MRVPRELTLVRVVATSNRGPLACETRRLVGPAPAQVAISIAGGADQVINVAVAGYLEAPPADPCSVEGAVVLRRARTRFVGDLRLYLPMPLRRSCASVACDAGQTCLGGECAGSDVGEGGLVEYEPSLVYGDTSFCFPRSACFEDVIPAVLVDPEDCTFQLPDEVPDDAKNSGRLNLEVLHEDLSREVLDLDPVEGFVRVRDRSDRFRIAPSLCKRYRAHQIASLYVGANCPPKESLRPLCKVEPVAGPAPREDTLCTSPLELPPARAAVYALVDSSRSMRHAFGSSPFKTAVDLVLRAQFLRNTVLGMRLLPGTASACVSEANPFATLDGPSAVPLGPPDAARAAFDAILGYASRVRPNDPPLFLDAALHDRGAYQALSALGADVARKSVVIVGNRELFSRCSPSLGATSGQAYFASQKLGISTSVLLLAAEPDADYGNHDPYIDGLAIARSGGGRFGDGTGDDKAMRLALAAFAADVGSCLYDVPQTIDTRGDLSRVSVSYFDVLRSQRADVPYDSTCKNGWALDGARVRFCGNACNDMRFAMSTTTHYAIERGFVPVDFPVRWAAPCAR